MDLAGVLLVKDRYVAYLSPTRFSGLPGPSLSKIIYTVFRKIDSFRGEGSFEGWLRRIFVNTAIEQFRRKTYLQPITEREENSVEATYLSVLDNLAEKDIVKLVQQLSPGYRTVFNMYVVEGYTHRQIAEALGISEGTSKSQLSRAKIILQELVKKHIEKKKEARNE